MNSFGINDKLIMAAIIFGACVLVGGSFWGGFQVARRIVEHPIGMIFLTLLFGGIILGVVGVGLVAGCMALGIVPMFG